MRICCELTMILLVMELPAIRRNTSSKWCYLSGGKKCKENLRAISRPDASGPSPLRRRYREPWNLPVPARLVEIWTAVQKALYIGGRHWQLLDKRNLKTETNCWTQPWLTHLGRVLNILSSQWDPLQLGRRHLNLNVYPSAIISMNLPFGRLWLTYAGV